jgi:hypothetical protein
MRKTKLHIAFSYLSLIIFISWQVILCTHYHKSTNSCSLLSNKHIKRVFHLHKVETEKCLICMAIVHKLFLSNEILNVTFNPPISILVSLNQTKNFYNLLKFIKSRGPPINMTEKNPNKVF